MTNDTYARYYSYEQDAQTGQWHMLMFGQRNRGFRPFATEAEAKQAVADAKEAARQADEDDAIYSRRYDF
jgi:hypothetical protein